MNERTPAYWPTRILLMLGFIATGAVLGLSVVLQEPAMVGGRASILGLPARLVVGLAVATAALTGLAWMIRIFREPRDDPLPGVTATADWPMTIMMVLKALGVGAAVLIVAGVAIFLFGLVVQLVTGNTGI